jgi:hypothetical protein
MVTNLICGVVLTYYLRFLYILLGNILSPAETVPLLARIIWTDISILLVLKVLGYAVFWIVYLYILYIIPYYYSFLDQAVRLYGVIDSHN